MILQQTDVAVVGGGMVGSALALGLAQQGLTVTVIERRPPPAFIALAQPNVRISAIVAASVDLLNVLGVWDMVRSMRAHPYRRLETWEWESAHVTFDASELKLPQLGYMVENNVLQQALWQALEAYPNVILRVPASIISLHRSKQGYYYLTLNDGDVLPVLLVVGADSTNSQVRKMANIGVRGWQYDQSCMLITVQCEHDPGDCTWQYFTPNGPRAFLPLFDDWASLAWYDVPARIHWLRGLSMLQLEREIARHFPEQLGKVMPRAVNSFPLMCRHALQYVREGLALVGDAAHTIHPLAGQGVNLGYRDVDALLDVISYARSHGEPWASLAVLLRYQRRRMADNLIMQSGMDLVYAGFSNGLGPVRLLRNIGLMMAERASGLKRHVLKYALGFYSL